jgi:hypothetical protein
MKRIRIFGLGIFFLLGLDNLQAQNPYAFFSKSLEDYYNKVIPEKLFIHTDKNFYLGGEILWLKANLLNAKNYTPLDLSCVVYIELFNLKNELVFQSKLEIKNGKGHGSFIIPENLESGNYTLRAYTRWMQNFDPDLFYSQQIRIFTIHKGPGDIPSNSPKWDVQFFPEGGNLVYGLESIMGVRIVGSNGSGVEYKGYILNQKKDTVCSFKPLKFGLGHFNFLPLSGSRYYALIKIAGNPDIIREIPEIQTQGIVMRVEDSTQDLVNIRVHSQKDSPPITLFLVCQTRGNLEEFRKIILNRGQTLFILDKTKFLDGISQITLFDTLYRPLTERLIFKKPRNNIRLSTQGLLVNYPQRGEIQMKLKTETVLDKALLPELSLSVYLDDSLNGGINNGNILSYLWLQSDIKGGIEQPEFYLGDSSLVQKAMNNLLLTQGWRRFKWKDVFQEKLFTPQFLPEMTGPILEGEIKSDKDSPLKNQLVYLSFPSASFRFYSGISDSLGHFQFLIHNLTGTHEMILQSFQKNNDFKMELRNGFSTSKPLLSPGFWTPDYKEFQKIHKRFMGLESNRLFWKDKLYKTSLAREPKNFFFGKPDYHYELDNYTRFPSLSEVITEYVRFISLRRTGDKYSASVSLPFFQKVYEHEPLYLLDGVPVSSLDTLLKVQASKVKSLDVIARRYYYGPLISDGILSFNTYQGDLNGYNLDPKAQVLEYEGTLPDREFFSPIYSSFEEKDSRIPDFRTTLFWNPDLIPDQNNLYRVHFFTSDLKGNYRIEINGMNRAGDPVHEEFQFKVIP